MWARVVAGLDRGKFENQFPRLGIRNESFHNNKVPNFSIGLYFKKILSRNYQGMKYLLVVSFCFCFAETRDENWYQNFCL